MSDIQEAPKEYTKEFMTDCYNVIMSKKFKFPHELKKKEKIQMLDEYIKYFESQNNSDDFLRCAKLKNILENIKKPSKRKKRKK